MNSNYPYNSYEVIICDSNSTDGTADLIKKFQDKNIISIKYLNCDLNTPAFKRNKALDSCKNQWVIYLDDDAIISKDFLSKIADAIKVNPVNTAFCAEIRYPVEWVANSNYHRYRNSRHISYLNYRDQSLDFTKITTMALAINKQELQSKNILFNLDYKFSLEDAQYGVDLAKQNINVKIANCICWHNEASKNISTYLLKIARIYSEGYLIFKYHSPEFCKITIWYKLEKFFKHDNIILKFLVKLFFSKKLIKIITLYLEFVNSKKLLYCDFMYKYIIVGTYVNSIYE